MDEIDNVVDNLFGPYITKSKDVAAVPSEPPPNNADDLDATGIYRNNGHPDIIRKKAGVHPDIITRPGAARVKPKGAAGAAAPAQKSGADTGAGKNAAADLVAEPADIEEIKKQTATMLRHLHKAILSPNWWHKVYYANKFLLIAANISMSITKRENQV